MTQAEWASLKHAMKMIRSFCQRRWYPIWVGVILLATILLHVSPGWEAALQFERQAIANGQWWRLLTGNFTHYSWPHLFTALGVFTLLCWMLGRSSLLLVALSSVTIGFGIYGFAAETALYRGISGVNYALLAMAHLAPASDSCGWEKAIRISSWFLMVAKSVFELVTGQVIVPLPLPDGCELTPMAHLAGLFIGTLTALVTIYFRRVHPQGTQPVSRRKRTPSKPKEECHGSQYDYFIKNRLSLYYSRSI